MGLCRQILFRRWGSANSLFPFRGFFVISDGLILTGPRWEIPKNPVGAEGSFFFVSVSQFLKLGLAILRQQS